jgi:hypothetical protein
MNRALYAAAAISFAMHVILISAPLLEGFINWKSEKTLTNNVHITLIDTPSSHAAVVLNKASSEKSMAKPKASKKQPATSKIEDSSKKEYTTRQKTPDSLNTIDTANNPRELNWFKQLPPDIKTKKLTTRNISRYGINQTLKQLANQTITSTINTPSTHITKHHLMQHGANGETFIKVHEACFEIKEKDGVQVFWFSDRCKTKSNLNVKALVDAVSPAQN